MARKGFHAFEKFAGEDKNIKTSQSLWNCIYAFLLLTKDVSGKASVVG